MKPPAPHNKKAARILRKIRRLRILRRRDLYLRNIRRRRKPRLIPEVPIEVKLSSSEDDSLPTEVHPVPAPAAEKPGSDYSLLDSTASEKETPEARNNPLEAASFLRIPRLN